MLKSDLHIRSPHPCLPGITSYENKVLDASPSYFYNVSTAKQNYKQGCGKGQHALSIKRVPRNAIALKSKNSTNELVILYKIGGGV